MNLSFYFAKRLLHKDKWTLSSTIAKIAIAGVGLGIIVLILSFAITTGFRQEIQNKVVGFGSHINIVHYDNNNSYQQIPIEADESVKTALAALPNVKNIQAYSTIAGIVRGGEDIEGLVFKGVGIDYDTTFFAKNIIRGRFLSVNDSSLSNEILISETLSRKLQIDTGDKIEAFFIQNTLRQRKFTIVGIYNTGLVNYDETYLLCDIHQVQKLHNWTDNKIEGWELVINDFDDLENTAALVNQLVNFDMQVLTIKEISPMIFDWIDLVNQNVFILIILIVVITSISLVSTQLTFILENITTIGIMKTMGCQTKTIAKIFLYISTNILLKGLLVGNIAGLLCCFVQQHFHLIKLNPMYYYMSYVPIQVEVGHILFINFGVLTITLLTLILPAYMVAKRISAVKAVVMK